jgi:hypothetical protein
MRDEIARVETLRAVRERREAEAREFCRKLLAEDAPPGVEFVPNKEMVAIVARAIEYGRKGYMQEQANAAEESPPGARFTFIEWEAVVMEVQTEAAPPWQGRRQKREKEERVSHA